MPTFIHRHDDDGALITLHDIETLTGWRDLAGFVVLAVGNEPVDGLLRVHMAADTSDAGQIVALLSRVSRQLYRDA